jgi:hypothetical protein
VTVKAVISQDASKIRVADEEDAEQVIHFALVPIGTVVQIAYRRDRCRLVGVSLDPDAGVVADRKQVVYNLESLVSRRIIDCGDVDHAGILGSGMVFEEGKGRNDAGWGNVNGQLVFPDREPRIGSMMEPGSAEKDEPLAYC